MRDYENGERYEGEWKDGKRSGYGTLYNADYTIKFEGDWRNDRQQQSAGPQGYYIWTQNMNNSGGFAEGYA